MKILAEITLDDIYKEYGPELFTQKLVENNSFSEVLSLLKDEVYLYFDEEKVEIFLEKMIKEWERIDNG